MPEIREYLGRDGHNLFGEWFRRLNSDGARRVRTALYRIGLGNFSNVKGVGSGVYECKIDFGPGYRLYFGKDGEQIVILLCGGTKERQQSDIETAKQNWQDYKRQKRSGPMALTRDFRETVMTRMRSDEDFRRGSLRDAVEALLGGETALGREILRDFINATMGFPALAEGTGIHVKTLHQMFGPKGNPTAAKLFSIIACLQENEGVKLRVVA